MAAIRYFAQQFQGRMLVAGSRACAPHLVARLSTEANGATIISYTDLTKLIAVGRFSSQPCVHMFDLNGPVSSRRDRDVEFTMHALNYFTGGMRAWCRSRIEAGVD